MTILITGGCGFIGSNFIIDWLAVTEEPLVNLDNLTYASNIKNLYSVLPDKRYRFYQGDIADSILVSKILEQHSVRAVINFAAETHVDQSIATPEKFINTNIDGTFHLLETVKKYWSPISSKPFIFLHVSTDEVYGRLSVTDHPFSETHPYQPSSPYSASKASSDHLVKAYYHTYGLPTVVTNCSNNYGRYQHNEKLIPLVIENALKGKPIPIYGSGKQIRDWLHVSDHCNALRQVLSKGEPGNSYNIGGDNEKTNIEVVDTLCSILDRENPRSDMKGYSNQITFVQDRQGHDFRYAVDATKIRNQLGWEPKVKFEDGIKETVNWYLKEYK